MKVLLIEDQALLGSALAKALGQSQEIELIGFSDKASEALALCCSLSPDIVIMDIFTVDGNGIECTALIKREFPLIKVLILTGVEDDRLVKAAEAAGADLFAHKSISLDDLLELLRNAHKPYRIFPRISAEAMAMPALSDLELRILQLLAKGKTSREVASELFLSYGTVRVYISRMYATTGMKSRAQLVAYALRCGMIAP
jgi:DNA-binding NarL/FixJ family response regulator